MSSPSGVPLDRLPTTPAGRPDESLYPLVDVAGPTVKPLILGDISVFRGSVPGGRFVPMHAHASHTETFVMLSGVMDGVIVPASDSLDGVEWIAYGPGELIHVPAGLLHAWRNSGQEPAVALIIAGAPLANFFLDLGKPVAGPEDGQWPPDPALIERELAISDRWGVVNATPEQNAAIGLPLA